MDACGIPSIAPMAASLTTHVLDTVRGCAAEGMTIEFFAVDEAGGRTLLKTVITNWDGRLDAPLLAAEEMRAGFYELVFHVGEYFRRAGDVLADPAFLDEVPLRFGLADVTSHYHVPLLVSPWAYSTYRGS